MIKLKRQTEFSAVFKSPKKNVTTCFLLKYIENNHGFPRLGMSVGKRHIPLAVDRNRIKRVIRETFRHAMCTLPPVDVVVVLKASTKGKNNQVIQGELERQWAHIAKLSCPSSGS